MIHQTKAIYLVIAILVGFGCSDTKKTATVEEVQQTVAIEQTAPKVEIPSDPKKLNESKNSKDKFSDLSQDVLRKIGFSGIKLQF